MKSVLAALLLALPAAAQVQLAFEPQKTWAFRSLDGVHAATEWNVVICQSSPQARQVLGLQVYALAGQHFRYLSQATIQGWLNDANTTKVTVWRYIGYGLSGAGFLATTLQSSRVIRIDRPPWAEAILPSATGAIGSVSLWWGKQAPPLQALPANILGPFINLAPAGQVGSCAEQVMFAQPQQNESGFREVLQ